MHNARLALAFAVALSARTPALAQTASLTIKTVAGTRTFSLADMAQMPRASLRQTFNGKTEVYEGVPLNVFLKAVNIPSGPALKGQALTNAVIVHAKDDYEVVLALAETDPAFRAQPVLIADTQDGEPLGPKDGPLKLVVPGDLKPARSARMIDRIEVRPLGRQASQ